MGFTSEDILGRFSPPGYFAGLLQTPKRLGWMLHCPTREQMEADTAVINVELTNVMEMSQVKGSALISPEAQLKKCLTGIDLMMFGVGIILGAGIFVTTGYLANQITGPAVVLAYCFAAVAASAAAFCYAEFGVDFPYAGGSFSYTLMVLGEFVAFFVVCNMILNYILANAAVARSFAPYFASLINTNVDNLLINGTIDFFAFGLILLCNTLLAFGTRESATFNLVVTMFHIFLVTFIIILGFCKANTANLNPFFPPYDLETDSFGWRGVIQGASIAFFSYIGFDAVASTAEECKDPSTALPVGILGSMTIVTVLYVLACLALVMMVPYTDISENAAFSEAFKQVGWNWASYIVAVGALVGIVTGVLVGSLGVIRLFVAVCREKFFFPFFEFIYPKTKTPLIATITLGCLTAIIGLFTAFDSLINLISIAVLFTYAIVSWALIIHRYIDKSQFVFSGGNLLPMLNAIFLLICSICLALYFRYAKAVPNTNYWWAYIPIGISILASTGLFYFLPKHGANPSGFTSPLFPLMPCVAVPLCTLLCGTLPGQSYFQWAMFLVAVFIFYIIYGLHASYTRWNFPQESNRGEIVSRIMMAEQGDVPEPPPYSKGEEVDVEPLKTVVETA